MEIPSNTGVLGEMTRLVTSNATAINRLGTQAMVVGKFLDSALSRRTGSLRVEVTRSFRLGIENALSMIDDLPLPAEYHS
jgi:hypothetical protein